MELLRLEADAYCRLMSMVGQLLAHFQIAANAPASAGLSVKGHVYAQLAATLREMEEQLAKLNLPLAQAHFERMKWSLENDATTSLANDSLTRNLSELTTRVIDELQQRLFLNVPLEQSELYLQLQPPFGESVNKHFPQMLEDISEAGKCLGLNRSTACVFHLMRVMELAVQRFGEELGVQLAAEKNWQVILDQINAAIRKWDVKDAKTKAHAQATSHLYNVNVAWRNEVMHPKQTYTFEEAKVIFDNVRTFISDLTHVL